VEDLDVRDQVLEPRDRLLGPVDARIELPYPPLEDVLTLVEVGDLPLRIGVLQVPVAKLNVAADRHAGVDILGPEIEPVGQAALVQEARLAVEERLDLLLQHHSGERRVRHILELSHQTYPPQRTQVPRRRSTSRADRLGESTRRA